MSCKEVADLLGVSIGRVYLFCKRNNIVLKKHARGGDNVKDMLGQKIGALTVQKRAGSKGKLAVWECRCACDNICFCLGVDLRQGKVKTCGCRINVESRRNWQGYNNIPKSYWSSLVQNAERRNIEFKITIEDIDALWSSQNGICNISGMTISFQDKTASLDRIQNHVGYVSSNIQWIHKDVNKMKQTFSQDRLIEVCIHVANFKSLNQPSTV